MFPAPLTSPQITRSRQSHYWSRTYCCVSPNEIIFRAQVVDTLDTPFIEFAYENTDIGDDTVPLPGLTCYLSPTTNIRDAIYRGRVRAAPTSDTFYIDYNSTIVPAGTYILVAADSDYFAKVRQDDNEDSAIPFHNVPPMISGLPGCVVLYDADGDGVESFAPTQTGVAVADGASIDDDTGWAWAIRGGGATSYTSGSDSDHQPVIELTAGHKYMIQCTVTDSNGVSHFQWIHCYVVTRTFTLPVVMPASAGQITSDLENGFSASIVAYGDVNTLADRSHVAIWKLTRWGDNTSAPVLTNLRFSGRLRSESIQTAGSEEGGQLQQVSFDAESMTAYMLKMRCPPDIIRHKASPAAFGEIKNPSLYRELVYYLDLYTTFLNQGSFTAGDGQLLAWLDGGEPRAIDGGYALDVLKNICDRIKASPSFAPDGSIHIEQLASFKQDRSGIQTIMDFELDDMQSFEIERDTSLSTGQMIAYGGYWDTVVNVFVLLTALAPTVAYGDGSETGELSRSLLQSDSTTTEAEEELKARAGNQLAYNNPKPLLRLQLRGCWNWLQASGYDRYTATIPGTFNTRGVPYTDEDFFQLQSVSVQINTDGTDDVIAELVAETSNEDAQTIARQSPSNLRDMNPVHPMLSDYPASPDTDTWMYPTDNPAEAEKQPIGTRGAWLSWSPFPPDQAAEAADKQPAPNCFVTQVNMRNPGTTTGQATQTGDPYLMRISGFGKISDEGWTETLDFTINDGGMTAPYGSWSSGQGWIEGQIFATLYYTAISISRVIATSITGFDVVYDMSGVTGVPQTDRIWINSDIMANWLATATNADGTNRTLTWNGAATSITEFGFTAATSACPVAYCGGTVTVKSITLRGLGTNPFTMTPGTSRVFADWFYSWTEGDDESAQVFDATAGGLVDGGKGVIPEYSPDHVYPNIPYTGSGNALQLNFALSDRTGTQSKLLTVTTCKV